jgi:hypothetical protein
MTRVSLIMEYDCEEFEELNNKEKADVIRTVLDSGAEATNSYIKIESVAFLKGE